MGFSQPRKKYEEGGCPRVCARVAQPREMGHLARAKTLHHPVSLREAQACFLEALRASLDPSGPEEPELESWDRRCPVGLGGGQPMRVCTLGTSEK